MIIDIKYIIALWSGICVIVGIIMGYFIKSFYKKRSEDANNN